MNILQEKSWIFFFLHSEPIRWRAVLLRYSVENLILIWKIPQTRHDLWISTILDTGKVLILDFLSNFLNNFEIRPSPMKKKGSEGRREGKRDKTETAENDRL